MGLLGIRNCGSSSVNIELEMLDNDKDERYYNKVINEYFIIE